MDRIPAEGVTLPELAKRTGLTYERLKHLCRHGLIVGARKHPLSKRWWVYPPGTLIHPGGDRRNGAPQARVKLPRTVSLVCKETSPPAVPTRPAGRASRWAARRTPKAMDSWTEPNGQDFRWWRLTARLGQVEAARFLGVAPRTIRHWESSRGPVPYAAYKLMKIRAGYALPDPDWDGWMLRGGILWSPANQAFQPEFMGYLSLVFRMAEAWTRSHRKADTAPAAGFGPVLPAQERRGAPPAAPGCPAPLNTDREAANDAGEEGKGFGDAEATGPALPVGASGHHT